MTELTLAASRIRAGIWEGRIEGASGQPAIEIICREEVLPGLELSPAQGGWTARLPIPANLVSDGVQTFIVRDADGNAELGSFAIIAGDPGSDDLRAEVSLLRAELDMLKRAFRNHCAATER